MAKPKMNSRFMCKRTLSILAVFAAVGLLLSSFEALAAADRVYHYESINVNISILADSDIQISET